MEEIRKKLRLQKIQLLVLGIVLFIGLGIGYFVYQNSQNEVTKKALPAEWSEYKSQKYEFGFNYPSSWGEPQVTERAVKSGKHYDILFKHKASTDDNSRSIVSISMDSEDVKEEICENSGKCFTGIGITKSYVEEQLVNKDNFTVSDSTSYARVVSFPEQKISGISAYQIVQLPQLKVTAVAANYHKANATGCPEKKFSIVNEKRCVTRQDYEILNRVLKSFKAL